VFDNNRVTCRFKRPLYVPREETLVDLHLSWFYLLAWGPAIQGQSRTVCVCVWYCVCAESGCVCSLVCTVHSESSQTP
jgi:hypothetical protein